MVLPELVQSGYLFADHREALSLSETPEGPTLQRWGALARELNIVVVGGFCERLAGNELANSAAMIDAQGLRAVYRKAHLWDAEREIFTAGTAAPPVVETVHGRIGMLICYDLEFPEWVRLPALAGADLLCAPVNWPDGPRPLTERPQKSYGSRLMRRSTECSSPPVTDMATSAASAGCRVQSSSMPMVTPWRGRRSRVANRFCWQR